MAISTKQWTDLKQVHIPIVKSALKEVVVRVDKTLDYMFLWFIYFEFFLLIKEFCMFIGPIK